MKGYYNDSAKLQGDTHSRIEKIPCAIEAKDKRAGGRIAVCS